MYTKSFTIVAMRGRNPDNPSERSKSNGKYKQRIEPNRGGVSNALTSVEKDNLVMEELILKKERTSKTRPKGKGWEEVIMDDGRKAWVRLRKLTPRECFRLQGVREHDIDTLLNAGISDSQLYKLAGNSICVDAMVGIFRNAFTTEEVESITLF